MPSPRVGGGGAAKRPKEGLARIFRMSSNLDPEASLLLSGRPSSNVLCRPYQYVPPALALTFLTCQLDNFCLSLEALCSSPPMAVSPEPVTNRRWEFHCSPLPLCWDNWRGMSSLPASAHGVKLLPTGVTPYPTAFTGCLPPFSSLPRVLLGSSPKGSTCPGLLLRQPYLRHVSWPQEALLVKNRLQIWVPGFLLGFKVRFFVKLEPPIWSFYITSAAGQGVMTDRGNKNQSSLWITFILMSQGMINSRSCTEALQRTES